MTSRPQGLRCHERVRTIFGLAAVIFGVLTILSGGRVLFGGHEARVAAGAVVDIVLLFNFGAGFFYVAAGIAALRKNLWAPRLATVLAITTLLVFAALGVHIAADGAFEPRTLAAMTMRSVFWLVGAVVLTSIFKGGEASVPAVH